MLAKMPENRRPPNIKKEFVLENADKVTKLAQMGGTNEDISAIIGISERALSVHFREILKTARANLHISLRTAQVQSAVIDRNPSMLVWLGKNYLKQREPKQEVEHSGGFTVEKVVFCKDDSKD